MLDKWNERFSSNEYAYGKEPNIIFKEELEKLKPGKILLPAEGEGRNAVFAAKLGWDVTAFDYSEKAREKALKLAEENGVHFKYEISTIEDYDFKENEFDAIGLVFCHIHEDEREQLHHKLVHSLKQNGHIIMVVYDVNQLKYGTGGPKEKEFLYTLENLVEDFIDLDFVSLSSEKIDLSEGLFHKGTSEVIRFTGKKEENN
ncbi:MAG: class I SAM-dependent methyltransferase [Ignavibacteriaceae bacterium]|nr:class I SAM-dependent methyltransferase [Ignavibacteriaceae bacterium]